MKQADRRNVIFEIIYFTLILILTILVYIFKNSHYALIIGSLIFGLLSLRYLVFESEVYSKLFNRNKTKIKPYYLIIGFFLFCLSLITLSIDVLLPNNVTNFIFIFLFILIAIAIILTFMWKWLKSSEKGLSLLSFILPFSLLSFLTLGGIIKSVSQEGITSFDVYIEILMFVMILLWYLTLLLGALFESIAYLFNLNNKLIRDKKIQFNLSITLTILFGGYFYLIYVSNNDLRDFLVMLGLLLSLWLSISSDIFKS